MVRRLGDEWTLTNAINTPIMKIFVFDGLLKNLTLMFTLLVSHAVPALLNSKDNNE